MRITVGDLNKLDNNTSLSQLQCLQTHSIYL
nr:MAG TPA: hypothetical protein [Caudoviricetes sp.]